MIRRALTVGLLALAAAGCGGGGDPVDDFGDQAEVDGPLLQVFAGLAGNTAVGDPVALTRQYAAAAVEHDVPREEMLDVAADLEKAGCGECAQIVSDAANG